MVLKRKIYKKFLEWQNESKGTKAFMVEGARRIGKSTICEEFGKKLTERKSLIIFDEVQIFPQARAAIKYLVADGRYDYIETGSLISIKENVKDIVIPSEERHINMYPLDFYAHYNKDKHRNDIEIDFIISNNSKLKYKMYPIELKSGKQYKTTSLNNFREKFQNRIGESYIIHPKNLIIKDGIICIPPYMTMML